MPWWDEVLNLLRNEFAEPGVKEAEPATARQAETLLKRTTRELVAAKARAEAARRRMLRAQDDLHALSINQQQHPSFRDRLTALAKAIAHESELVEAFDAHIKRLEEVHARVQHEFDKFERDLQMARTAKVAAATTQRVNPSQKPQPGDEQPGFRRAQPNAALEALKGGPRRAGKGKKSP